ncbi:MAG: type VI secretion system baseplate subunit TssG [Desulfatitalea sp.]|nr:type VI secretion system baseplate subunit TssG [Desulfatitalea sp.]NNK02250.1 type VI secretion system baseplate subunit TssG [Desulfatitalea sp.]
MAGTHRRTPADIAAKPIGDVRETLLSRGSAFAFFQAVRLLRHLVKDNRSVAQVDFSDWIRVRPHLSLAFPTADIETIESADADDHYRITATFLGLYGSMSPLPTFYTEDLLAEERQDESVSRDFLDIFNQRLYDLLYTGWLKYRQYFQVAETQSPEHLERLYCLIGMGPQRLRRGETPAGDAYRLLRYIGLFTQFPRSAAGLATMLSDALKGVPLRTLPCIPRKAKIPESQTLKMGLSGCMLGMDSYVGDEIEDRMGKFRIQIGPVNQADFLNFTPGGPGYQTLTALTELYINEPLAYEVELILAERQAKTASLGDPMRSALGVTTWVFSQPHLGEVRTRFSVSRQ